MCGIFGIYKYKNQNIITSMQKALSHRGPDESGIYSDNTVSIGNNRLSIIDLSSGKQPIYNEDKSMVIVYNGELFNYKSLRNELIAKGHFFRTESDTETILHAYEEYGEKALSIFNGFFAFAIWNIKKEELFIARDRLGIKPLYIYENNNSLAFASEAKAILKIIDEKPEPDWQAVNKFFTLGYVPTPYSPFKNIKKMPTGSWILINGHEKKCGVFWEPLYGSSNKNISFNKAVSDVDQLLLESIRMELAADVPVGLFLSGGLDSSAVAYYAKKLNKDIRAFILGFEESTHDESSDARLVAEHLKLNYKELKFSKELLFKNFEEVFNILDEPFGDSTVIPLLAISKYAKEEVKVVLTGWGGDELFAGYPTYKAHNLASIYRSIPRLLTRNIIEPIVRALPVSDKYMSFEFKAKRFIKCFDQSPDLQHFAWMGYYDEKVKKQLFKSEIFDLFEDPLIDVKRISSEDIKEIQILDRIQHLDAKFFMEGNGLFQADRITMAASLEARVPILNNNLFDYVSSLPSNIRMPGNNLKAVLKKVLEPHLPKSIINKPKKGFGPPSSLWIRNHFAETLRNTFSENETSMNKIFRCSFINQMINEHMDRKVDHGRELWLLLSFGMWYKRFINGETIKL